VAAASAEPHPIAELDRLEAGIASERDFECVVRHLLAGCEVCGERMAGLWGVASTDQAALSGVIERSLENFGAVQRRAEAERTAADELVTQLRDLPDPRRRLLLRNIQRARRRAVCERLIDESRAWRHESAAETLRFAELAVLVAERLGDQAGELRARAYAERGNARRITGDLAAAERDFIRADKLLATECTDPLVKAEMLSLRASLARDSRSFDQAIQLLLRAASRFSRYGDMSGLASILIQLGHVYGMAGEPNRGIGPVVKALRIATTYPTEIKLAGLSTLAYLLAEAGEAREAIELIRRVRPLFSGKSTRLDRFRLDWLAARTERDLGNPLVASQTLARLREVFIEEDLPYDAARVSLDLACAFADLGQRYQLKELATETASLFSDLGIAREHIASLSLLAQATRSEIAELTAALHSIVKEKQRRSTGHVIASD
jgi:tetratricopeptide (TPR) repeat protein